RDPQVDGVGEHDRHTAALREPAEPVEERAHDGGQPAARARRQPAEQPREEAIRERPVPLDQEEEHEPADRARGEDPRGGAETRVELRIRETDAEEAADDEQHVEQALQDDARQRGAHPDARVPAEERGPDELAQPERQHGCRAEPDRRRRDERIHRHVADGPEEDPPPLGADQIVSRLIRTTARTHPGRARDRTSSTPDQSVPRVAKYRQANETAMPTAERSAVRRRVPPATRSGPAALFPGTPRDERLGVETRPAERPEARGRDRSARQNEQPRGPLPRRIEAEPETQDEEQEARRPGDAARCGHRS